MDWDAKASAKPDDLFAPLLGKLSDMCFFLRQAQLRLKPEIRLLSIHKAAFPQASKGNVRFPALAAQFRTGQGPHRQAAFLMGGNIGIAGRIPGADIERSIGIFGSLAVYYRRRSQDCPGTTVGTFDIRAIGEKLFMQRTKRSGKMGPR